MPAANCEVEGVNPGHPPYPCYGPGRPSFVAEPALFALEIFL
jgi:hypothetical protein